MIITFEFEKTNHELDCMRYRIKTFYKNGGTKFNDIECSTSQELKNLLTQLKSASLRLENFLETIGEN